MADDGAEFYGTAMIEVIVRKERGSGRVQHIRDVPRLLRQMLRFLHAPLHGGLTVVFVSSARSRILNRSYRKKDASTDILSFIYQTSSSFLVGEIVLAPARIRIQARDRGVSFRAELTHILLHGLLHCLGMHHEHNTSIERRMQTLEQRFLEAHVPNDAPYFHS